jgi:hypothetical protein
MSESLYDRDFSMVFNQLLGKANISCYKISEFTHIDQGYLSCLRNGTKKNPGPEIVMKIGLALVHCSDKISLVDIERLFNSVGRSIRINRAFAVHN